MTADYPYPAIFSPAQGSQAIPSERYETIDWRALLRMNVPATPKVSPSESKQVLTGKAVTADSLAGEFPKLVKQWKEETFFHSSLTKVFTHPAYQRIMAMGTAGLPFVLGELQKNQGRWFYALKFMAGKDVAAGMKNSEDARTAWLEWGYKNNYI